jgi:signal transduction histidine kinase
MVQIPRWYYDLAPETLPVQRQERYRGDQMSARLDEFRPPDQTAAQELYSRLQVAHVQLREASGQARPERAQEIASWTLWTDLVQTARRLDAALRGYPERIARVIHDLRGGSLTALVGTAQVLPFSRSIANDLLRCAYYARDHLKIMRNCVPELDREAGDRDREGRAHSVRLLVEKWAEGAFQVADTTRRIRFVCTFDGNVSERCLEFSALDRVIYNLVNNAARHTSTDELGFAVFPVGTNAADCNVRFVVTNPVSEAHRAALGQLQGGDVSRLMTMGVSTTGGGLGLRICAEFVAHAYGLRSVTEVVQRGYAGTRVHEGQFVSWFHWPCAA